ncbi:MAG: hypothetical protein B6D46_04330 [Polyangiaceae bacterium UTPRO1]|jgi:hypothetical protein|nr:hypothetical protein [Myxococcales bacterium]OQY68094.1 MAG: hypothetical protein B6D46_04330 [Polyangiaceae bacterium UTPRO1]
MLRRLVVVPLLLAVAGPAAAFDLTGSWTGTCKCKFFDAGVKSKVDREGTVAITQVGNALGFDSAIGSQHLYSGIANFGTEKPDKGELSVRHCRDHVDTTPFDALGRFSVKTKTGKVKATITGITIVANDDVGAPSHGTCKWKLTRTATTDPGVPAGCGIPSRRAVKTDVAYLTRAETRRLHDELVAYRLAKYRYAASSTSSATHLGFIIDDVPQSPAVAASGDRVDLYAYTSMAVAALQTQAREIAQLQRAVAKLNLRHATQRRAR